MRKIAVFIALIIGASTSAVFFLWLAAGEIYDYRDTYIQPSVETPHPAQADVVLCLAGGKRRIAVAVNLWKSIRARQPGHEPVLFLSGVGPKVSLESLKEQEIDASTRTLLNNENVIFENVSENTLENAQLFSSFVRQKKWKQVVLVTANYHMRRAAMMLGKVLDSDIKVSTYTVDAIHYDRTAWHQDWYAVRVTIMEYIKWLYYQYHY